MRILHTSDWHLGQHFHGRSRAAEHEAFAKWLIATVRSEAVDAVIVAGDIFDTGAPPSYARELYLNIATELADAGCETVMLAGNHDSVAVLNEASGLLKRVRTHVISSAGAQPQVLLLNDRSGQPGAIVCAVPFLRPRDIASSEAGQSAEQKQQSLQAAIVQHYQQLFADAKVLQACQSTKLPIIATGHLTTVGAKTSESVREIYIGSLQAFPSSAFPDADYIALGHIHRSQQIGSSEHIRYSGSPIALSFDELKQPKSVVLADFCEGVLSQLTTLAVPVFQPLFALRGKADEVLQQLQKVPQVLAEGQIGWLSLEITSADYPAEMQRKIEATAADLPVMILLNRHSRGVTAATLASEIGEKLHELSPADVFQRRLSQEPGLAEDLRQRIESKFLEVLVALQNQQDDASDAAAAERKKIPASAAQQGDLL